MDVEAEGVKAQEKGNPAQVTNDGFFVLEHPSQDVVLIGFGVVITNKEDRTVSEGTTHQEDGDVLVMGVKRCLGCVVLRDEGIRRHCIHVLRHQAGDHAKRGESKTKLEVQAVVDGVVETFVASTQVAGSSGWWVVRFKDLADGVTDSEVRPIHMAGDHEDHANSQMVMGDISQPKGFGLRVEATKEGKDCSA